MILHFRRDSMALWRQTYPFSGCYALKQDSLKSFNPNLPNPIQILSKSTWCI
jgi:hypothetical protein